MQLGIKGISPLLGSSLADVNRLLTDPTVNQWAKEFVIGVDSLHNLKGGDSNIVARLLKFSDFDSVLFLKNLETHVQRRLVSELDGAHFRLLVVKWEKVILPALHSCKYAKEISLLFDHLAEVRVFPTATL